MKTPNLTQEELDALLTESRRISKQNDANDTWVDGEVVEARMKALREAEVNVAEKSSTLEE